jgi:hypothetical protein
MAQEMLRKYDLLTLRTIYQRITDYFNCVKSMTYLKSGHFLKTAAAHLQNRRNSCADLAESADFLDESRVRAAFIHCIRVIREPLPPRLRIVSRLQVTYAYFVA